MPVDKVKDFESEYLDYLDSKHSDIMNSLKSGKYSEEATDVLTKVASELAAKY